MAHDVFVSHSAKDKAVAAQVVAHLEDAGIRCWVAPRDVVPGADWGESIVDAIESSKVMVLIFSLNANNSSQIKREVERAADKNVYTIPVRIDDIEPTRSLEYFISNSQWMDAYPPPIEPHLDSLARTVKAILARQAGDVAKPEAPREEQPRETVYEAPPSSRKGLIVAGLVAVLLVVAAMLAARYFTAPTSEKAKPIASADYVPATAAPVEATAVPAEATASAAVYSYEENVPNKMANAAARGAELESDSSVPVQTNITKEPPPNLSSKFAMPPANMPNLTATRVEEPSAVVQRHYESINRREVDEAFGMLSTGFKARRPREQFEKIFADTTSINVRQVETLSQTDNTAVVSVLMNEVDSERRAHKWNRTVYLVKEGGLWKIDRTTQGSADTPEKPAKKAY